MFALGATLELLYNRSIQSTHKHCKHVNAHEGEDEDEDDDARWGDG